MTAQVHRKADDHDTTTADGGQPLPSAAVARTTRLGACGLWPPGAETFTDVTAVCECEPSETATETE